MPEGPARHAGGGRAARGRSGRNGRSLPRRQSGGGGGPPVGHGDGQGTQVMEFIIVSLIDPLIHLNSIIPKTHDIIDMISLIYYWLMK